MKEYYFYVTVNTFRGNEHMVIFCADADEAKRVAWEINPPPFKVKEVIKLRPSIRKNLSLYPISRCKNDKGVWAWWTD